MGGAVMFTVKLGLHNRRIMPIFKHVMTQVEANIQNHTSQVKAMKTRPCVTPKTNKQTNKNKLETT